MKAPRTLLAVFAVLTLVLAACAPEDIDDPLEDDTPTPTPDEATPTPEPDDEEAVDDDEAVVAAPGLESDEDATVVEILSDHGDFGEFVSALEDTGLAEELDGEGPFTVFAPTDDAFDLIPDHEREELGEDLETLEDRLRSHIYEGELTADELTDGETIEMMDGSERQILATDDGMILVGSAQVVEADVQGSNGIIHVIDFVLPTAVPAEEEPAEDEDEDDTDEDDDTDDTDDATDDEDEDEDA